ncbi:arabinogalactan protein 23-like [Triticum urartu]|uniref:arabinogalactan protein 23-like n=1 Tax=Triticum urartu TaxID=4572 RepID=UPI002043F1DD|nr:arabinogalactan protein 23-like [Triticum urartu]
MAAPALPSFLRQSNKDNPQSISRSTSSSPPFFSGSGALVRAFVRDHHLVDQEEMEMKKIACAVLVAASATVALAADAPAMAPAPGAAVAGSAAAAVPAVGAVLGATVLSFFAYYLQ